MSKIVYTDNGYTVSVITGGYGSTTAPYEVGVWETESGTWVYDRAPFEGDVLGWQTREGVQSIIAAVKAWPEPSEVEPAIDLLDDDEVDA